MYQRTFRPDIQGLRAVAIVLVVLYHAHLAGVHGGYIGVDVFFVISGFLITRLLITELDRDGRLSLRRFWARRVRRLLPAAMPVVVVTLLLARFWLSPLDVRPLSIDAMFTAVYALNYRLAALGVQYQQATSVPSALQHFWSLAVEEQFYVAWPLILSACAMVGARHWRRVAVPLLVGLVAYSLYQSIEVTSRSAPLAYFSLHTRAWELGLGALVAFGADRLVRLPAAFSAPATWAGLGAILFSAWRYSDTTPFPGSAALLPVVGTALVLACGARRAHGSAEALLQVRPMQDIGRVSYSWYLWHWPLLVLVPRAFDTEFSWGGNAAISMLSLGIAVLAYRLVERPALESRWSPFAWLSTGAALSSLSIVTAVVVVAGLPAVVGGGAPRRVVTSRSVADARYVERVAHAIEASASIRAVPRNLAPPLATAPSDHPASSYDGCHANVFDTKPRPGCVYGDHRGRKTMVLYGDSHAQQWLPAFTEAARREHWKVISWTKSGCPAAQISVRLEQLNRTYRECDTWHRNTTRAIRNLHPNLVVVAQKEFYVTNDVTDEDWARATVATLRTISRDGVPVRYMLDTPSPRQNVPACLAQHLDDARACGRPSDPRQFRERDRLAVTARAVEHAGYTVIEPRPWLCSATWCPVVVGNLLVYRDADHMTPEYSKSLAPLVERLLRPTR